MRTFLFFVLIVFSFAMYAQQGFIPLSPDFEKGKRKLVTKQNSNPETLRTQSIWYEDFDGANWSGTSNSGQPVPGNAPEHWLLEDYTGNDFYWRWDTVGPRGLYTSPGDEASYCQNPGDPLYSSTSDNGFMMLEADWYNTVSDCSGMTDLGMDAAVIYTNPIDFSAYDAVHLKFEQYYRLCCSFTSESDIWFEVSEDGGATWTAQSVHVTPLPEASPNPAISEFDISSMVAGKDSITFRFRMQGLSHYHWEIDDVRFIKPYDNDILLLDYWNQYIEDVEVTWTGDFKEGFYEYPWFLMQEFVGFNAAVKNFGGMDQTNVYHYIYVYKEDSTCASVAKLIGDLEVGDYDTTNIDLVDPIQLTGKGLYTIEHFTTTSEGDDSVENNTIEHQMLIGDSILCPVDTTMINDKVSTDDWIGFSDGRGLAFRANFPDPNTHADSGAYYILKGVRVFIPDQRGIIKDSLIAMNGASLKAEIYEIDSTTGSLSLVIESDNRQLTMDDIKSYVSIPFLMDGNFERLYEGGDYLVNVAFHGTIQDELGQNITFDIGHVAMQKYSSDMGILVEPNGTGWSLISSHSPAIALSMGYVNEFYYLVNFTLMSDEGPIDGAVISIDGAIIATDETGQADINLPNGEYNYTIAHDNYSDTTGVVEVNGADVDIDIQMFVGVQDVAEINYNVYPNPTRGKLNIDVDKTSVVAIYNAAGKIVREISVEASKAIILDVPAGVYFVKLLGQKSNNVRKIIVH